MREDKHRENYLGNSVAAPKGRWQQGRDIQWYNRDASVKDKEAAAEKRRKELLEVKQAEQEAMNEVLYVSMLMQRRRTERRTECRLGPRRRLARRAGAYRRERRTDRPLEATIPPA